MSCQSFWIWRFHQSLWFCFMFPCRSLLISWIHWLKQSITSCTDVKLASSHLKHGDIWHMENEFKSQWWTKLKSLKQYWFSGCEKWRVLLPFTTWWWLVEHLTPNSLSKSFDEWHPVWSSISIQETFLLHLGYDLCEDQQKLTEGLFLRWRCWTTRCP